jgi:hypothetical protein
MTFKHLTHFLILVINEAGSYTLPLFLAAFFGLMIAGQPYFSCHVLDAFHPSDAMSKRQRLECYQRAN